MIIAKMLTCCGTKLKALETNTPRVLKNIEEKSEVSAPAKRFNAIAAMNLFAFALSIINANKSPVSVEVIADSIIPRTEEPVPTVNAKVRNPHSEIKPSKKRARQPVYSLKSAPVAASKRGHEKAITLSIFASFY